MRRILACCVAALLALAGVPLAAQAPAGGDVPRRNGVPDFTGIRVNTPKRGTIPSAFDPATGNYRTVSNARNRNSVDLERDEGVRDRMFGGRVVHIA